MTKKFNAEVLGAVVNGKNKGEKITLTEKEVDYLASIGYVRKLNEVKAQAKAQPKSTAKPKATTKDKAIESDPSSTKATKD